MFFLSISLGDATQTRLTGGFCSSERTISWASSFVPAVRSRSQQDVPRIYRKEQPEQRLFFLSISLGDATQTRLTGGFCSSGEDYHLGI